MTTTTTTVSVAEFARMVDRSRQSIHELIKRGKLTVINGRIYPELGKVEFANNVRPRTSPLRDEPAVGAAGPTTAPTYSSARAREVTARASLAELDLAKQQREVLVASEVYGAINDATVVFRAGVEAFRDRMPSQLAALGADEALITACLAEECARLIQTLSKDFARLAEG